MLVIRTLVFSRENAIKMHPSYLEGLFINTGILKVIEKIG